MKAWLITWEWSGEYAKVENPVASILNPRLSPQKVKEIVELLYVNQNYTIREKLAYSNNKKFNPYPAYYTRINGIQWLGEIFCGHNPYLFARKVEKIKVEEDENGNEVLSWKELPKPNIKIFLE
jgi:hypothetical protein